MGTDNTKFGFDKNYDLTDDEIEKRYVERMTSESNKVIADKLFRASLCDPRRSDVYFDSNETAMRAKGIADKLNDLSLNEFSTSDYSYKWLDELSGAGIFKVINKDVLKSKKGKSYINFVKKIFQFVKKFFRWILLLLVLTATFYWFQVRPQVIRRNCESTLSGTASARQNNKFRECLVKNGLAPESLYVNTD